MPALRYRNAGAAIDWLGKAFGFEKKMAVPTEDGRIAHAELVRGNGMIMLGDAKAEYGSVVRPRRSSTSWLPMPTLITPEQRRQEPRSCSSSRRKTMAAVTILVAISKATSGPSAPMIRG